MFSKSRNLLATAAAAVILGVVLYLDIVGGPLQVVCGLVLLFALPGYAWVEALFLPGALRMTERVVLSFGLSLALAIVGGLLLNLTPWGLQASSWAVLSTYLVLLGVLVALVRRTREVGLPELVPHRQPVRPPEAALFGLAVLLAVAAGIIGLRATAQQQVTDFTQLWMLESGPSTVQVGVANLEQGAASYRLEVRQGDALVKAWSPLVVRPGDSWQVTVALPPGAAEGKVQAVLYRLSDPNTPYRIAQAWMSQVERQ